jgi:ABC-type antimicrobial peptide transport system permease subunit
VIVDEHTARQLWTGGEGVGKRIRTGGIDASASAPWITVVGVVGRIKQDTLDSESRMAMYLAHAQYATRSMNVVLRSGADPAGLAAAARKEIRGLDPDLPVYNVRTMTERVNESLARRRFSMVLLSVFAPLAASLAVVGIYGVVAYFVSRGTSELGIRMALGATPAGIRALVIRQALVIVSAGIAIGLVGALTVGRLMRSLLFGIGAIDPVTFASIPVLLALVALLASSVPARRASRIDPMLALRHE